MQNVELSCCLGIAVESGLVQGVAFDRIVGEDIGPGDFFSAYISAANDGFIWLAFASHSFCESLDQVEFLCSNIARRKCCLQQSAELHAYGKSIMVLDAA